MSIIEQIKLMPSDAEFLIRCDLGTLGTGLQGYGNDGTVQRLKALAESHERLLKIVKGINKSAGDCHLPAPHLLAAIKEAEKL